jgi:NADH:quinone reductase (non-electrogenic)
MPSPLRITGPSWQLPAHRLVTLASSRLEALAFAALPWNVVIAGGGYGGLFAARTLECVLPRHSARITLVNDVNFMLYTPLLPGAAAGTLEPRHVVVPLREELHETELRLGRVTGAQPDRRVLDTELIDGRRVDIPYDQLIVALGSVSRTLPIPGLAEHAIGFKTLSEAIALRNRVLLCLETAEAIDDPAERAPYLSFIFVGAGYAGLEGLAELQDFAADVIDLYPRCRLQGMRWTLVEKGERVMPEISPSLARFAERELRGRGIEILCETQLDRLAADRAVLSGPGGGRTIPTRTLAWTAGVKPHSVVEKLGLPLGAGGRIVTDRYMQVQGFDDVWAIGDAAAVPDPARRGHASPPTAQHVLRQGKRVARNVAAALGTGRKAPFRYRTLGVFVDMGRHQAVASTLGIRWKGFPAWWLARTYHLAQMPGTKRKARLVTDWTAGLLFDRDASELGQLGHPPTLEHVPLEGQSAGGTGDGSASGPATRSRDAAGT